MSSTVVFTRAGLADGARSAAPLALGAMIFGMALGVLAASRGLSTLEMGLMSTLVFAGASQVVALELWASPVPALAIIIATLAVNSRHILMGATMGAWLTPMATPAALGCAHLLVDETWALSMVRIRAGSRDAGFLVGAGLTFWALWIAGGLLGHAFGALAPDPARFGLDFLGVAVFLCLLTLFRPGRGEVGPFAITIAVTLAAGLVLPGKWNVLAGALAGAVPAVFARPRQPGTGA